MKLQIQRGELLSGLQRVQGVVERRNTMPILANVLLDARGQQITIFATDLEIGIHTGHPAQIERDGGVAVAARKFYEIIRELPELPIELSVDDSHQVRIKAGKSEFRIMGLGPHEFPTMPSVETETLFPIERKLLSTLIRKAIFSVGDNDARYILNGLQVVLNNGNESASIRLVGTDGHRLAVIDRLLTSQPTAAAGEVTAIVPKKAALEIRKLIEEGDQEVQLGIGRSQLVFRCGGTLLLARLMEGNYPNYQQVIPKGNDQQIRTTRIELEGALRRVSILSREKTNAIKLELLPGVLVLSASHPDMGEAREELAVAFSGEPIVTGFNARYLMDVLAAIEGEEVILEFRDALSPCVLREQGDKDYLCVVMPMRV